MTLKAPSCWGMQRLGVVDKLVPSRVNASEGIVPTELCEAKEGPEFSSQYTGFPVFTTAFLKVTQYVPMARFTAEPKLPVSVQTSNPYWLPEQELWMRLITWSEIVPPNSDVPTSTSML